MERDTKNIYKNNNINICGLDLPFEENDNEDHIIDTCVKTIEESYHELKNIYLTNSYINNSSNNFNNSWKRFTSLFRRVRKNE